MTAACSDRSRRRSRRRATCVLITIDTLRADHVGAYGWSRARTPTLDALAAERRAVRARVRGRADHAAVARHAAHRPLSAGPRRARQRPAHLADRADARDRAARAKASRPRRSSRRFRSTTSSASTAASTSTATACRAAPTAASPTNAPRPTSSTTRSPGCSQPRTNPQRPQLRNPHHSSCGCISSNRTRRTATRRPPVAPGARSVRR